MMRHTFRVLGIHVDTVQIPEVVTQMEDWIEDGQAFHRPHRNARHLGSEHRLRVQDGCE